MNVLVTGGTGTLGRHVVMRLRQSGHRARILSRQPRGHVDAVQGDLKTGAGLEKAVAGMDAIVHAATGARQSLTSRRVDVGGTRRLIKVARKAGINHIVYVSIVGIDGAAYPYYRTKVAAESIVRESAIPWSILRATQFHELIEVFLRGFSRLPGVVALPLAWQFQCVEAREVARRVVDGVLAEPAGLLADFGGPEVRTFTSLAEAWLNARKDTRRIVNLPLPFKFSRQIAEGKLITPDHKEGTVTFEEYLADRYPLS
ncbi:MAG TPA: NAD(P)H-binding protein [Candidatus Limnocylindrales bacterium]|nr:NAD(P)H-binding protein [Candidatus Limnocylindrales bacterium]